jgi:hypothetical protein
MPVQKPAQVAISEEITLDGRLALIHRKQGWMAVADLHFGYELSQRAAGRLMPMWGMHTVEQQLSGLLDDYQPRQLIVLGDVVHDAAARMAAWELMQRLGARCELIVLAGNHDRGLAGAVRMHDSFETDGFYFHHGHCAAEASGRVQLIGHHHPAGIVRDGAGLRLKLPAFVQQGSCWIMPAFSPWAAGSPWKTDEQSRVWLCSPQRIFPLPAEPVSAR